MHMHCLFCLLVCFFTMYLLLWFSFFMRHKDVHLLWFDDILFNDEVGSVVIVN